MSGTGRPGPTVGEPARHRFVPPGARADAAVLIVTYQSADTIAELIESLRAEAGELKLRVIVVDNASTDATAARLRAHDDITTIDSGRNLGYAAGINLGMRSAGDAPCVLVLNPDLRVEPGCVRALLSRLRTPGAGVVVPAILDADRRLTTSIRREPSLLAALGDAVFGSRWTTRPQPLSETVRDPDAYRTARPIDWATGAALLIDRSAAERVGPWDERFFLYSEETDFLRRVRSAGYRIWYEPAARVVHDEAGSGRSPALVALTVVNAIRYTQKHRPWAAGPHRAILLLHELRRWRDPTHRLALAAVLDKRRWETLPHASGPVPLVQAGPVGVDHVLVTRFNLPSRGPESLIRAQEGWLQERVGLFERFTVPSVRTQTVSDFSWIVYLDPESPQWLLARLAPLVAEGVFTPLYREEVTWQDLAADASSITGARSELLITTNLDNDDALAVDFVERLQQAARRGCRGAVYLGHGLVLLDNHTYLRYDANNAFCSVIEGWSNPKTAWRDWHILLGDHLPVVTLDCPPAWLQVIHGRNVSNRVRGRLVDPETYRDRFAGLIDEAPPPSRREIWTDAALKRPIREVGEQVRSIGKRALLRGLGKGGLERFRAALSRGRGR